MNPNDLKQILDALTYADVREFSLRTGSFDLSLIILLPLVLVSPTAALL
ncbi:hypothetical protein IHN32_13100, partial [Deinococcus sp. 14RED07]|nr:hypothetical protein [Deinococcus sp. 14RED07]